jgi:hypothetical protein
MKPARLARHAASQPIDLSPIEFDALKRDGRVLTAAPSLRFEPHLDEETHEVLVVEDTELDLHVFGRTREELIEELIQHLFFVWDAYAREDPHRLTPSSQRLREIYLGRFVEVG